MTRICTGLGGGPRDEVEVEAFFSLDIEYKIDEDGFVYDNDSGEAVGRYHKNTGLFSMHPVMKSLVAIEQPGAAEQLVATEQPEFANTYRGDMLDAKNNTNTVTRLSALGRGAQDEVEVEPFFSHNIEYKIDEEGFIYDKTSGEGIGKYNQSKRLLEFYEVGKTLVLAEPPHATVSSDIPEPPGATEQPDTIKSPYMFPEVTEERIDEFANKYRGSEGALTFATKV